MCEKYYEVVEVCPHCEAEVIIPMWDVEKYGYVAKCNSCEQEIFLCLECMAAYDNPIGTCNWEETETGGYCFRGRTIRK